jgi:hypothetical protein
MTMAARVMALKKVCALICTRSAYPVTVVTWRLRARRSEVAAVVGFGLHRRLARRLSRPHLGDNGALLIKSRVGFGQRGGARDGQAQQPFGQHFCRSGFGRGRGLDLDGAKRGGRRRLPSRPLFPLGQQRGHLIPAPAQFLQQVVRRWRISLHPHATIRPQAKAKASALGTSEDGGGGT